ncbi:hypothetical protein HHI36_002724 [Cryptolaemus montrouzieri]|uniref:Uncharacterized protein n=1 Tax=Cryptolaemus montrouzieri TaxID=559131 RepID=A0ABD2PCA2_9CUCU
MLLSIQMFLLITVSSRAYSAKILAYFSAPSISHQYVYQPIWKELSIRGHNVTVITPNPLKDPELENLTEIDVSVAYKLFERLDISNLRRETTKISDIIWIYHEASKYVNHVAISHDDVGKIMNKPEHYFDLIIFEANNLIGYGLQHKFKAPSITISSLGLTFYTHYIFGNPVHPILYPDGLSVAHGKLSLWQKFDSLYVTLETWWTFKFYVVPDAYRVAQLYFGSDMPYIEDLMKKV